MFEYFNREMRQLNHALLEYSQQHPDKARALNLTEKRYKDPEIDRLLEGVAFVGSQIKQHIDRDIPEISELLLGQIAGDFLLPIVATSVLQVQIMDQQPHIINQRQRVKDGACQGDVRHSCYFETKSELHTYPITVDSVEFCLDNQQGCTHVTLSFDYQGSAALPAVLPLYIHADNDLAYRIYTMLCHDVKEGWAWFYNYPAQPVTVTGLHTLLMNESKSVLNQLKTFFTAPEQFLYCFIHGLDQLQGGQQSCQLELRLTLDQLVESSSQFSSKHLKTNCVNIENAFTTSAEPIQHHDQLDEHKIVIDHNVPDFYSVVDVKQVFSKEGGAINQYIPLQALRGHSDQQYYQVIYRQDKAGQPQSYIRFQKPLDQEQTISCELLACNNHYPRRFLMPGDINRIDTNRSVTINNLHRPTPYCVFDGQGERTWRCIAFMQLHISSLLDLANLQSYLLMCVWHPTSQDIVQKIESIYRINHQVSYQAYQGVFYPALMVNVEINESAYSCVAEVFIWGEWLYAMMLEAMDINHLLQLNVHCMQANVDYQWQQQQGRQYAL